MAHKKKDRNQSVKGLAVLERLQSVLKQQEGMSGRKFAEAIGLKAESATRLFNGVTGLTKPLANSIELKFGYRAEWLLTGEGNRRVDPRRNLDTEDLAALESLSLHSPNDETLNRLIREGLVRRVNEKQEKYMQAIAYRDSKGDALAQEIDVYTKLWVKKSSLLEQIDTVIESLRRGNLNQVVVSPLFLAIHFLDRWDSVKGRSTSYRNMLSFGASQAFEEALLQVRGCLDELDELFRLSDEEESFLTESQRKGSFLATDAAVDVIQAEEKMRL